MTRLALMLCAIAAPAAADVRLVVMPAGSDHLAEIVLENGKIRQAPRREPPQVLFATDRPGRGGGEHVECLVQIELLVRQETTFGIARVVGAVYRSPDAPPGIQGFHRAVAGRGKRNPRLLNVSLVTFYTLRKSPRGATGSRSLQMSQAKPAIYRKTPVPR